MSSPYKDIHEKIKVTTLSNGIRVATDPMNVYSVAINFHVNIGSRVENAKNNGLAHFFEHMAFKSTENYSTEEIARIFDRMGGTFNAYTSNESTVYHTKILNENKAENSNLKIALHVLADIIHKPLYNEEDIAKEKGVVIQEIAENNDTPSSLVMDRYIEAAFQNQPLGAPILGTVETVSNLTREDILNHIQTHYTGNNIIISAAGNIDHDELVSLVGSHFSEIKPASGFAVEAAKYTGGTWFEQRSLDQVNLVIGFGGVSYLENSSQDFFTANLLSSILGGGMSSRLFQILREREGLTYSIDSQSISYKDTGTFAIYTSVSPENTLKAAELIANQLKDIASNSVTDEELDRVNSQLKAAILMSQESVMSRSSILANTLAQYDKYLSPETIVAKYDKVTQEDIKILARKLLSTNITVAAIGDLQKIDKEEVIKLFSH